MVELHLETIIAICGALGALLTAIYYMQNITKNFKNDKKEFKAEIIQNAKEEDSKLKTEIEGKLNALQQELEALKESVNKDLGHMKETYNGEIRNLGEKIEDLRSELRKQHGSLVNLLTKMLDKSKWN